MDIQQELYRKAKDTHTRARELLGRASYECAMLAYSDWIGNWNEYHGNNRWQRLPGGDHTALGDCRATLKVLRKIAAAAEVKNGTEL
jgi:DNA polymerase III subunit epsilon